MLGLTVILTRCHFLQQTVEQNGSMCICPWILKGAMGALQIGQLGLGLGSLRAIDERFLSLLE